MPATAPHLVFFACKRSRTDATLCAMPRKKTNPAVPEPPKREMGFHAIKA